jgi:hypothetical protein
MNNDEPMSLKEAEVWLDQHKAELMQKAERQTLNYLAMEKAIELAKDNQTEPKKD